MKRSVPIDILEDTAAFRQQVRMAAVQVNGLRSDELQMALAYEVEPSSGVPAAEAELAFRAVPDPDPTVRVFEVVVRRRRATEGGVLRRWRVPIAVCLLLLLAFVAVDFVRTSLALSTMTHEVRTREALQAQVDAGRHAAAADRRAAEELRTRRQNVARAQDEAARLRAAWPDLLRAIASACGEKAVLKEISASGPYRARLAATAITPEAASQVMVALSAAAARAGWRFRPGTIATSVQGTTANFDCEVSHD